MKEGEEKGGGVGDSGGEVNRAIGGGKFI